MAVSRFLRPSYWVRRREIRRERRSNRLRRRLNRYYEAVHQFVDVDMKNTFIAFANSLPPVEEAKQVIKFFTYVPNNGAK
jgi:hypothetical protein